MVTSFYKSHISHIFFDKIPKCPIFLPYFVMKKSHISHIFSGKSGGRPEQDEIKAFVAGDTIMNFEEINLEKVKKVLPGFLVRFVRFQTEKEYLVLFKINFDEASKFPAVHEAICIDTRVCM